MPVLLFVQSLFQRETTRSYFGNTFTTRTAWLTELSLLSTAPDSPLWSRTRGIAPLECTTSATDELYGYIHSVLVPIPHLSDSPETASPSLQTGSKKATAKINYGGTSRRTKQAPAK